MRRTQDWVEGQTIRDAPSPTEKTRDWLWQQYVGQVEEIEAQRKLKEREAERKWWEAAARNIDKQAQRWVAQAEAARQAALLEAEKTRRLQDEVRKVRERAEKREAERRRIRVEAKIMSDGDYSSRIQTRKKRENAKTRVIESWNKYESRWRSLQSSPEELLTFQTVPWPLIATPSSPSSISGKNISFFLLSSLHSGNKSRKERIREAMQRWHNDKFEPRILPRVVERDRGTVKEGVDIVVRCLNDLLARVNE
ncbi:hypothetical protein BU17DRAFT_35744 [Hysterangium stoloniferum]|nr:hypothetical protein BU17DRAFT_35744 [Hysterangium stoloniferum]